MVKSDENEVAAEAGLMAVVGVHMKVDLKRIHPEPDAEPGSVEAQVYAQAWDDPLCI